MYLDKRFSLPGGLSLQGYSRATQATCWMVPELGIQFDMGCRFLHQPQAQSIFLTHTHTDHFGDILFYRSWKTPLHLYIPFDYVGEVQHFLEVSAGLTESKSWSNSNLTQPSFWLHGVEKGSSFEKKFKGRNFLVTPVECHHSAVCYGYRFDELRNHLKSEYRNHPDVASLVRGGIEVNEITSVPLFAYLGDTTPKVLKENPDLFNYPAIVMECSFLDAEHQERADRTGHTCWEELQHYVREHKDTFFLLGHFSKRYSEEYITTFFKEQKLLNVCPLI